MKFLSKAWLCAFAASQLALGTAQSAHAQQNQMGMTERQRLIVLTDIGNEPDDAESMVRLLLYANDIDIEGLIAATSHHLPRHPNPQLIRERIVAYGAVLPNLRVHDSRYPDAEQLQSRVRTGSPVYGMSGVGKGKDTEASRLIIAAVDRPDPRPVWISVWAGAADLAQALWTVRATRSPRQVERFVARLRVYSISDQDDAGPWARAMFPDLFWETSVHGFLEYENGTWLGVSAPVRGADQSQVSKSWLAENIQRQGPLGKLYPTPAYIMEGDTPSFLSLIPSGLSMPDRPDWGGWGGRYAKVSSALGLWATTSDTVKGADGETYRSPQATIWRWRTGFQNDFAARMAWSVTPEFKGANHAPIAVLNGQTGLAPVELKACPGQPLILSAKGSTDPDSNSLTYNWVWYREASGNFAPNVALSTDTGAETNVTVAKIVNVDQFTPPPEYKLHVILEVHDDGVPALTRYRRAIISVKGVDVGVDPGACAVKPVPPSH